MESSMKPSKQLKPSSPLVLPPSFQTEKWRNEWMKREPSPPPPPPPPPSPPSSPDSSEMIFRVITAFGVLASLIVVLWIVKKTQ